jgi:hypothetical protein
MSRLAIWCALAALLPASAAAGTYRAGPLAAFEQNGDLQCEGGDLLVFPGGDFAVVPRASDQRVPALIDSRGGRARVGNGLGAEVDRLRADAAICAGPVDCDDTDAVAAAVARCWQGDAPLNQ